MLKKIFLENLGIKLVSLFLALLIWFHATTEKNYTQTIRLPVKYSYTLPDSFILLSYPPKEVRLRITAKGKTLLKLKYSKAFYKVDIGPLDLGKDVIDMTQGAIPGIEGLEITEVSPKKVLFLVDRYTSKVIYSIRPTIVYDTLTMRVHVNRIKPHIVRLKGPRTVLRSISFISTDTILLDTFKTGKYTIFSRPRTPSQHVTIIKPDSLSIGLSITKFVFDTVNVLSKEGNPFILYITYPDTVKFSKDSLVCFTDTLSGKPYCEAQSQVKILKILPNKK